MTKSTKELARELGLLKKRRHVNRLSAGTSTVQPFKYLIVIDFESTCWENAKFRTQEIIEFPAVLLNTQNGEIESEFHHYVQPQEQPILSKFCTELTGITQEQVNDGIPVNLCLRRFCHWLNKLNNEKGVVCHGTVCESGPQVNTTCVTWSDWDLGVCLQYECKRKQLLKPVQLNVWLDLRATYRRFYDRKPNGLNGALQDLGIEFQGREHSGVDDARNTAKLAYRMIQDGCVLKNTRNMKDHVRSVSLPTTILLPTRKTPPRKAKDKNGIVSSSVNKRLKLKKEEHAILNVCQHGDNAYSSSSKVKETESFVTKDVVPIRKTPPRKAKEKAVLQNYSTVCSSIANSKDEHTTVKMDISTRDTSRMKTNTIETNDMNSLNCDCDNICLCEDLEQFLADCDNVSPIPISDNISSSNVGERFQKRKLSSEKDRPSCVNSPARKLPRHASTRLSVSDIYVDPDDCRNNSNLYNKVAVPTVGLKYQDTNRTSSNNKTSALGPCDSGCFKKPVCGSGRISISSSSGKQHKISDSFTGGAQMHVSGQLNSSNRVAGNVNNSSSFSATTPRCGSTNSSKLKTPFQTPSFNYTESTPLSNNSTTCSMKVTPPLCKCGRRCKRRIVQSPGQNMGRFFFSCSIRKRVGSKEGCDFFKWETSVNSKTSVSNGAKAIMKQFVTPLYRPDTSSIAQKRSLGIKSAQTTKIR